MGLFLGHNKASNVVEGLGYGYLYSRTVTENTLFMPAGWEMPTFTDWETLITFLGGSSVAGGYLKEAGLEHWTTPNTGADNSSGFTAFAGGYVDGSSFLNFGLSALFASVLYNDNGLLVEYDSAIAYQNQVADGMSVRGIYRGAGTPTTVADYEGNVYDVVLIGTQRWTVQNWKCKYLSRSPFTAINYIDPGTISWLGIATLAYAAYNNDETLV